MFGYFGWKGRQSYQAVEDVMADKNAKLETLLDQDNVKATITQPSSNAKAL